MSREIRLAKAGVNALTETDPNEFIFHSSYNTFKILASGMATFTVGAGVFSETVAHGQSVIPLAIAFMMCDTNEEVMLPGFQWFNTAPYNDLGFYQVYVDATNVTFYGRSFKATNTDIKFRYYIFESPLS